MNIRRIKPVILKEVRQIGRDTRTLGVLILIPAFLLIMYGYALDLDVDNVPTAVYDADNTPASRDFLRRFFLDGRSEQFDHVFTATHPAEIDSIIMAGGARLALVLPRGFSEELFAGRSPEIQVLVDGVMSSSASTMVGYTEAIVQQYTMEVIESMLPGRITLQAVDYHPRVWYNPELKSARFLIPGLIAFILMTITVVATSLSIVKERELGSMEQLMVSPLRPIELILGKLIPYAVISLFSTILVLLASFLYFDMPMRGSPLLLLLSTTLYLCGALGMGLLISTVVRSQEVAFLIAAMATLLPTFILSGFVFPISNMPGIIQAVTYLVPARYYLVVLRGIMLKGTGLAAFGDQILFLTAFAAVMLGVGTVRLSKIMG